MSVSHLGYLKHVFRNRFTNISQFLTTHQNNSRETRPASANGFAGRSGLVDNPGSIEGYTMNELFQWCYMPVLDRNVKRSN